MTSLQKKPLSAIQNHHTDQYKTSPSGLNHPRMCEGRSKSLKFDKQKHGFYLLKNLSVPTFEMQIKVSKTPSSFGLCEEALKKKSHCGGYQGEVCKDFVEEGFTGAHYDLHRAI
jgi:hypothetical protein